MLAGISLFAAVLYTLMYLLDPALPGHGAGPRGWWGWYDQSQYLRSTAALLNLDFRPSEHHYPFLYSMLGVPFYAVTRLHAFFAVDLIGTLAAIAAFWRLARRLGIAAPLAAVVFLLTAGSDSLFLREWVIPWNTIVSGAALWALLAVCAAWIDGVRRPFAAGLAAGVVVGCRPSDAVIILPCLATLAAARPFPALRQLGLAALGAAVALAGPVALHLVVFGLAPSPYLQSSAGIGFTADDFLWKAYVIWIDPFAWFADGEGMLQRAPWIALGAAGAVAALFRGPKDRMVAAALLVHAALYTSYVDLLPTGLWRFLNVHYFAWAIPGYALLGLLLLRDLFRAGAPRWVALASVAAAAVALSVRVQPAPVPAGEAAKAVDFAGPLPPFVDTFLASRFKVRDDTGVLRDMGQVRLLVYPGGVRALAVRREFAGPVSFLPGQAPPGFEGAPEAARWGMRARLRWPPIWFLPAPESLIPVPTS